MASEVVMGNEEDSYMETNMLRQYPRNLQMFELHRLDSNFPILTKFKIMHEMKKDFVISPEMFFWRRDIFDKANAWSHIDELNKQTIQR